MKKRLFTVFRIIKWITIVLVFLAVVYMVKL